MEFYSIRETLIPCGEDEIRDKAHQYVAIVNSEEWKENNEIFDMIIDIELETQEILETKAIVNFDSLTGCFHIPDKNNICGKHYSFSFALDEKGIVLIDDEDYVKGIVNKIRNTKKWRFPSMERFMYDLLEEIISDDLSMLEAFEKTLNDTEDTIMRNAANTLPVEVIDIRGDLVDLKVYYEQLIDFGQELEENENGFFLQDNLRFFRLFRERVERLKDIVTSQCEYIVQIRYLVDSQLEIKQNKIMTILTIITSIFMPLTLIAGWYGMNFYYMPELGWKYSYPIVIAVSVAIVVFCLIWFKKKKWL